MIPRHPEVEVCLDYLVGELPSEQRGFFIEHLGECSECQVRLEEYREIFRGGLASIGAEISAGEGMAAGEPPQSIEIGERRLYAAIGNEAADLVVNQLASARLASPAAAKPSRNLDGRRLRPRTGMTLAIAASMVAAIGASNSLYRLGVKQGLLQSRVFAPPPKTIAPIAQSTNDGPLQAQLHKLTLERDAIQASLLQRDAVIAQLKSEVEQQRKESEAAEASLQAAELQAKTETEQISLQRNDLARKLETEQAILTAAQKKLDAFQQAGTNDTIRSASLENRIQEITLLLKDKDARIEAQQRLLASDRDIRDLMGARDLYIAEVYDVGGNGKRTKPYGRVFYTKGKSLIFYGYDLDQQPGLKDASTFQAWGMRGPDRSTALNLGVMYVDNSTNRRWVLRFDDPKVLEQINAVFVTVEPHGASRAPEGKQVLFAYLKEEPNHP
jgi:hypothetical protein